MKKIARPSAAALAGLVGALLLTPASGQGQEPTRPGRLSRLLVDVQKNGEARATQGLSWLFEREAIGHLAFMATDPRGGTGGGGWYKPSQSRYGWDWVRQRHKKDADGAVTFAEFGGPREWFEALDKNGDGQLTAEDFDWNGDSALARASSKVKPLFSQIDLDGNGQITPAEWKSWFDRLSGAKGYIGQDDLLPLFMERRAPRSGGGGAPPNAVRLQILCSYIAGDVGCLGEGPPLDGKAPYFTLTTTKGNEKLDLSRHRGEKPLVLIFGSFT
jgi:EF hand